MAKKTYDQLINRLEEILELISNNEVSIEESLKLYKEGIDLVVKCNKLLSSYETNVKELKKYADDSFKLVNFEY